MQYHNNVMFLLSYLSFASYLDFWECHWLHKVVVCTTERISLKVRYCGVSLI